MKIYSTLPHVAIIIVSLLFPILCFSKIRLPYFFSNHMVLQQQSSPAIWGWSTKSTVVLTTSWNNTKYTVKTGMDGKWKTNINTPVAGGPYKIIVSDGDQTEIIEDILMGEVWLCSGQSNMEMPMKGYPNQPIENSNDIIFASENDHIRLYNIPRSTKPMPMDTSKNFSWKISNPQDVSNFSATAYFFGKFLYDKLKVPIGLINCSYGGSPIEAFMDANALKPYHIKLPDPNDTSRLSNKLPTVLYNGMIHPVVGFGIKGMIWYQGENNAGNAEQYEKLLPDFIKMLREKFGIGDFPFYYVQIAPYDYGRSAKPGDTYANAAFLRDAQRKSLAKIPNSGMAVTMDIGDATYIHPMDKQTIGKRLGLLALANTYQLKGFQSNGPLYKSVSFRNDTATVTFINTPNGLSSFGKPLINFEIAGKDQKYYPATAQIVAGGVEVYSTQVKQPVAVRYAFKNYVKGELFNTEGFPASSFRTDDWPTTPLIK